MAVWILHSVWEEESTGALGRTSWKYSIHRSMSPASPTQHQLQLAHLQPEAHSGATKSAFCVNSSIGWAQRREAWHCSADARALLGAWSSLHGGHVALPAGRKIRDSHIHSVLSSKMGCPESLKDGAELQPGRMHNQQRQSRGETHPVPAATPETPLSLCRFTAPWGLISEVPAPSKTTTTH